MCFDSRCFLDDRRYRCAYGLGRCFHCVPCLVLEGFDLGREEILIPTKRNEALPSPPDRAPDVPPDVLERIIHSLPYEQVFQWKLVSKTLKEMIESDQFQAMAPGGNFMLTAFHFFIENENLQWAGFDPAIKKWRRLPPLSFLPAACKPGADFFKEFTVCSKDGLVCISFSQRQEGDNRFIVFNPLNGTWKELPPLKDRRYPVLMHMFVDPATDSYRVMAAGSRRSEDGHLSRITEVYASCTGQWERTGDIPGPEFSLNEYQTGVLQNGHLFCIAFVELTNGQVGKGILAYNVNEGRWLSKWTRSLQLPSTMLQLVENKGEVFMFSEQENGPFTQHCIDRLEWTLGEGDERNSCELVNVVTARNNSGRCLEFFPEYTCVPYDKDQLCIFNTIELTGVVYDIKDRGQSEVLPALPERVSFFSLNPLSFTVEPTFSSKVGPKGALRGNL